MISENLSGVEATAEVTAASVDNLKFLKQGTSDIAFTMADTAQDALQGKEGFEGSGRFRSGRWRCSMPATCTWLRWRVGNHPHLRSARTHRIDGCRGFRHDRACQSHAPCRRAQSGAGHPHAEPWRRAVGGRAEGWQDRRVLLERGCRRPRSSTSSTRRASGRDSSPQKRSCRCCIEPTGLLLHRHHSERDGQDESRRPGESPWRICSSCPSRCLKRSRTTSRNCCSTRKASSPPFIRRPVSWRSKPL